MSRNVMTALFVALLLATTASADVLWDRTNFDPFGAGFFNVDAGSPPFGITVHTVNDVTVGGGGWNVETITIYFSALDAGWGTGIVNGYLHVYDKVGPLPVDGVDDPTASPLIPMAGVLNGDHWVVSASGLNLALGPGEYWIGITPIASAGFFGPELHLASLDPPAGDDSASYDPFAAPPTWFNFNPGVEAAILIEGTEEDPVSIDATTFGGIKALYR